MAPPAELKVVSVVASEQLSPSGAATVVSEVLKSVLFLRGLLPALYDDLVAQVRLSAQPLGPFVCRKASDTRHIHSHPSCQTSPASPCRKTGGGNARHASRPGSASSKSR